MSINKVKEMLKLVAHNALPMLLDNLTIGNLVHRDYEATWSSWNDQVNVPIPPMMVTRSIDGEMSPGLGSVNIVLNRHMDATFLVSDIDRTLSVPDLLKVYVQPAAAALAESIERDIFGLHDGFTDNQWVGQPGVPITEEIVDQAETALFVGKIPQREAKYLVVDHLTYQRFRSLGILNENCCVLAGVGPRVKEFHVFRSPFVAKTKGEPTTTHNLAFAREAIGLVSRRPPFLKPDTKDTPRLYAEGENFGIEVTAHWNGEGPSAQFTLAVLYGCGILRNKFGVQVIT